MGLLESSYESAEAGPLSPSTDWLRRPAPSARHRWTGGRPRCRSRSLQRRRVVSMFWGPRPPEPAGRSRSAEGSRHQPPGHAPHSGTPAEEGGGHSATPAGPTRSAPVTPTVVTVRGAPESPPDLPAPESPGDSPPDGQYRQTLRRLTGDIHGLLRRAEADDETDDGFGDGVVDGDGGDGDGTVEDGDASINGGDVCGTGVYVNQLENQGLTMPKELSVGDGECSDASDTPLLECRSRTLPSKLCRSPAVTAGTDAAVPPGGTAPGGVNSGRRVRSASTSQRVSLAPGQDRSGREHNTSVPETEGAVAGDDGPAAEEERLFDDSADDVLLMLMDSLPEPVTEPVAEPAREPVPKPESEDTTRAAPECEPEPGRRQEPGRKPLSVIVVTTVIDSSDGEGSPPVPPQQRGSTNDQLHATEGRSLQAPPDVTSPHPGESSSDAAISSDSITNDNPVLKLAQHQLSASEVASDGAAAGACASDASSEAERVSVGDNAASVDAEAAAFPRASDVDSGEPLCLLSGPQPDLWQAEEDQADGTVRFVAGLSGRSDCSYTCHQRCRDLVTLDCPSDTASDLDLSEVTDPNQDVDLVEVQTLVRCDNVAVAEVRETDSTIKAEMIEKYNATSHGLYMTLSEDGRSFHGFIRVHMNLFRPINIVAGTRPPSIYDVLQPEQTLERTLASFYLPRDTVKALHIDNDTTVHEVISSLLKKFKIVDDPRKFALYERLTEQGESTKVKMRRLADSERPLELALSWSHHGVVNKKFVLQENDTGDILWDNFTLPELNNFLTMLNKEEEDYKRRVRQKYTEMKRRIAEQMDQLRPGGAHTEPAPAAATAE